MTSSNPTPEELLALAQKTKQLMDVVILNKPKDTALFTPKDFWNGSYYEDEDGCAISLEEAQAESDWRNRHAN